MYNTERYWMSAHDYTLQYEQDVSLVARVRSSTVVKEFLILRTSNVQ